MAADASKSTSSADSYIGSLISLTSKSEIRYEGVLYTINADESSIGLRNVRSFGSEGRKKDGPQIPPSDRVYEYILFRGTDIKDLQVKSAPPVQTTSMVDSDPAIIQSHYPPPSATSTNYPPPPATLTNYPPPPAALTNYPPPPATSTNYPPPPATSTNYPPPPATSANYPPPPATSENYPPPPATSAIYPPPPATSTSFTSAVSVSPADMNFRAPQMGHPGSNFPGSNFPGGMPLYHQGASLGSWGPSPPSVNGNSLSMPVYWPGMYGLPNTLPHLHQHTFLQPPLGLSVPPALQQQMPYSGLSAPPQTAFLNVGSSSSTLPTTSSSSTSIGFNPPPLAGSLNVPSLSSPLLSATSGSTALSSSSLQSIPYSGVSAVAQAAAINVPNASSMLFAPNSSSAILGFNPPPPAVTMNVPSSGAPLLAAINSSSALPSSSLPPLNLAAVPSLTVASEIPSGSVFDKGLNSGHPSEASNGGLPTLASLTISDSETISVNPPVSNKASSSTLLPYQNLSQTATSVVSSSTPSKKEGQTPSLVTPGQLLQPKKSQISSQSSQITHKHVEVIQVSSSTDETVSVPKEKEAQPPILPLPPAPRPYHKPNVAPQVHHIYRGSGRHNYRGDGRGRGTGGSRPVTRFTEDFDFSAMNEKFNKDEVWDHLGKNKIHSDDKEGGEIEEGGYVDELPKIEVKPVYNKDDFFDSLSSNARNNESQNARPRFSEQLKIDAETFGEFARYRGGRGGRGPGRGGRGSNYGRGYGYDRSGRGYGHPGRGRGRALSSQAS